jgi:hypothetical protein
MRKQSIGCIVLFSLLCLLVSMPAAAQLSQNMQEMLRRINAGEFGAGGGRGGGAGGRWIDSGSGYTAIERNAAGSSEIIRYDTATGRREVLMTAAQLTPAQAGKPLQFSDYTASADGKRILFATGGTPTMIRKTA